MAWVTRTIRPLQLDQAMALLVDPGPKSGTGPKKKLIQPFSAFASGQGTSRAAGSEPRPSSAPLNPLSVPRPSHKSSLGLDKASAGRLVIHWVSLDRKICSLVGRESLVSELTIGLRRAFWISPGIRLV